MLAAVGKVDGTHVVAFCSDADRDGRRDGRGRLQGRRARLRAGAGRPGSRHRRSGTPAAPGWPRACCSLHAVGRIFHAMTQASGKVPQISVVLGPAAGGAAYGPALTDVVILGPEGRIFVTGPDVVRSVTGEDVDMLRLGGPEPHGRRSGVVHVLTDSEAGGDRPRPRPGLAARRAGHARRRRGRGRRPGAAAAGVQEAGLRRAPARRGDPRRGHGAGAARQVGAEHRHRPRPLRRPHRRRDREQPAAPGRLPGLAVRGEGLPLRADVRRLRGAAGGRRRRARLPARCRPGVGRRRTPRRQAAARLR